MAVEYYDALRKTREAIADAITEAEGAVWRAGQEAEHERGFDAAVDGELNSDERADLADALAQAAWWLRNAKRIVPELPEEEL